MTPVVALMVSPAGEEENDPPVAPVVVSVVVPVAQKVPPLTVAVGRHVVHVTVLEVVAELPQPSTAVNILVCNAEHEVVDTAPLVNVTVGVPHASVAVAVPSAAVISAADGLQPSDVAVPVAEIVGGVASVIAVIVCAQVAVLPQASFAI